MNVLGVWFIFMSVMLADGGGRSQAVLDFGSPKIGERLEAPPVGMRASSICSADDPLMDCRYTDEHGLAVIVFEGRVVTKELRPPGEAISVALPFGLRFDCDAACTNADLAKRVGASLVTTQADGTLLTGGPYVNDLGEDFFLAIKFNGSGRIILVTVRSNYF